ncbi:sodium/proton antiporter, NhaA family [Mycolicibacterium phlei]|uniref:Na(+)/H(+) antiporter NhaA n=3 Tax=Mycolicibacterium phlei TaxID=1771 RepID=A0A5N5VGG3_MYCPH|nr:Na+/H+ antiporter NhaA [Mycolicibacterium phlei]VEG11553.1 sodium/proton antiporter, NhaA family [Mycobacteroides chelonae]AMO63459.1 Na(+)/H(+) antiporter NhaA [Mycolicibacterium phlei]EID14526.1 Na+/H+ antiporter NhaA [Mycolicibacterium phlei RIVM601174]KAB7759690.1 sodium:proton antiporter [Mycolicibacterium phlei DSM 43239 = CCUG 21000]KXW68735.1 sodium:proton antiporter [Mycolicibacterium phlei DSM 43239 = CCUG 21000]
MTDSTTPRIVRLLPPRFSREAKVTRTGENTAAVLLLLATVAAVLWANSPWAQSYWTLLDTHVGFTFGDARFELTVKHLVNDGLMAFFFFIVGLEVKHEFAIGELTERARAAVPVAAAIAGLALPAAIFLLFNPSGENAQAWGVVISTDTAFLLGALAIIKPKFPGRLRIFLLTLAVVDDIGALGVIALFYTERISVVPLVISVFLVAAIAAVRLLPAGRGPAYAVLGFALWVALYLSGMHPTLAGVAVALLIPVFSPERTQVEEVVARIRAFRQSPNSHYAREVTRGLRDSISINERLQMTVGPYVSFVVVPLFALVNAGVMLDAESVVAALRSPLTWGIVAGLVIGKFVGITAATWLMQRSGAGELAPGLSLRRVAGGAALSGIGFTISLFIVDIAIDDPVRREQAIIGVLIASVVAFVSGWAIFRITDWISPPEPVGMKLVRPVDPDRDHIKGNPDAPLTLVEYGDFECPFCSVTTGAIEEVRTHFGNDLRYVWRHLPLERAHPRAFDAARASEAAALQGRFWEMARELFSHQDDLEWSDMYRYAVAAGCDIERFDQDVRVHPSKVLHRVADDAQDAEVMDLNSTPTFFVNGRRHTGPWDAASLIRALEAGRRR